MFRSGRAVGDGWHNSRLGKRSSVRAPILLRSGTCSYRLNTAAIGLVAERVSLSLQENICSRGPTIRVHSQISSDIAQEFYRRKRQVFGTQYVSSCGLGFAMRANCLHRKFLPARFPAGKKILKISSAIDIRWPLPLGSGVDQIHPPPSSCSMFRMESAHALLEQERRYSGGVERSVSRPIWRR